MPGKKGGNGNPGGGGGGEGPLYISGNKKDNTLTGGDYGDWINGKAGNDTLYGGLGDDELLGADGDDILYGEDGNDGLHGGDGDDELYGGDGNDLLQGGAGADVMDGGDSPFDPNEHDIASFVEVFTIDPATGYPSEIGLVFEESSVANFDYVTDAGDKIARVEEIRGTNYNDIMFGRDDMDDYLVGARGEDVIIGGDGSDTLYGSLDNDTIYVGGYNGTVTDIQIGMLDASKSVADTDADLLIFLRYTSDYNGDGVPEDVYGDGHDVVIGFDLSNDSILFLNTEVNPDFGVLGDLTTDTSGFARIDYAENSSILLHGVSVLEVQTEAALRPDLFQFEYVDV